MLTSYSIQWCFKLAEQFQLPCNKRKLQFIVFIVAPSFNLKPLAPATKVYDIGTAHPVIGLHLSSFPAFSERVSRAAILRMVAKFAKKSQDPSALTLMATYSINVDLCIQYKSHKMDTIANYSYSKQCKSMQFMGLLDRIQLDQPPLVLVIFQPWYLDEAQNSWCLPDDLLVN